MKSSENVKPLTQGIGACLVAIALLQGLAYAGADVPITNGILLLAISYVSLRGGVRAGLLTAAVSVLYLVLPFPGHHYLIENGELQKIFIFGSIAFTNAILVGLLKQKEESAVRREAEQMERSQAVALSEKRFRAMADAAPALLWAADTRGDRTFTNRGLLEFTGRTFDAEAGMGWTAGVHPDDLDGCRASYLAAVQARRGFELEFRLKNAAGDYRLVVDRGTPTADADGRFSGFTGSCIDITARRAVEQAYRKSETRFERLMHSNIIGIIITNDDGGIIEANDAFLALVGYTRSELEQGLLRWDTMTPDEYRARDRQAREQFLANGISTPWEKEYIRKDGSRVPILIGVAAFESVEKPRICFVLDMTLIKRAEAALSELSGRLLQLQDEERRRIARQLHDTTAQNLAALSMNLTLLTNAATSLGPRGRRALDDCISLTERCIVEIRTLSYMLYPPLLDELGLESALRAYLEEFQHSSGIHVDLEIGPKLGRMARQMETTVFRIVQESLANVHRCSESPKAAVRVHRVGDQVEIAVRTEGQDFQAELAEENRTENDGLGIGIAGLRERARHFGGMLEVELNDVGTTVRATLLSVDGDHRQAGTTQ